MPPTTIPIIPIKDFGFEVGANGAATEREAVTVNPPTPGGSAGAASPTGSLSAAGTGVLITKTAARAKMRQRPDSPVASFEEMAPKGRPPRPSSREPAKNSAPLHPKAQATIDSLNESLQIKQIAIPQYKFETYVDWNSLGRSSYDAEKMQAAFNFRFRGCKGWVVPNDQRYNSARVWQAIVDKVAHGFGESDAYIDQKANYYSKLRKGIGSGETALPDAQSWCEALSLVHVSEHVKADLKECLDTAETSRVDANNEFRNWTKELTDLRDYSAEVSKAYKQSVNDHCMVSISNDHLMFMASNLEDEKRIDTRFNSADQVEIERLTHGLAVLGIYTSMSAH